MSRIDLGQNILKPTTVPATAEGFLSLSGDELTGDVCAELADLLEQQQRGELTKSDYQALKAELKRRLHFYTPHAHFRKGYKSVEGEPEDSGKVINDFDNFAAGVQVYEKYLKGRERELGINMVNLSVSKNGFAILADIPEGLTRQQAQQWLSDLVGGIPYDKAVHDLERAIYIPCREYILYMDEELMFGDELHPAKLTDEEIARYQQQDAQSTVNQPQKAITAVPAVAPSARALAIFDDTLQMTGLDLPTLNREGVRHNTLKLLLPTLCQMMTQGELLGVLSLRMPDYSREQDCRTLVADFYAKYVDPSRPMTQKQREVFMRSLKVADDTTPDDTESPVDGDSNPESPQWKVNVSKLPIGLKESVRLNPPSVHLPVIVGLMPLAMALASDVTVRYCDNRIHYLGGMAVIKAEQSGQKTAVETAVNLWWRNMKLEDKAARDREDEVKAENKRRRARKEPELPEPEVVVRKVPVTISCSKLLKRLKQAKGKTLFSFCPEMQTLLKSNSAGNWSAKYDIYRQAFDRSEWGQDYNGEQSESGEVNVAYNLTIMGTPGQIRRCFNDDNVENGLSGRVLLAEINDDLYAKTPHYKEPSPEDLQRIDQAVATLRAATGFYDTPRLRRAIDRWVEGVRVKASKADDKVKGVFRKRSAIIGFRCGVIFMLLEGRESKACIDFAIQMAEYSLYMQSKNFGQALLRQIAKDKEEAKNSTVNADVFAELPSPFGMADLRRLKGPEITDAALYTIIHRWNKEGWIKKDNKLFYKIETQES